MNCQNFIERARDVARGALMDAAARAEMLSHEGACAPCAARLADERALTEVLRALAERDATVSAPPRVEAALLAAFRARHASEARDEAAAPTAGTAAPAAPVSASRHNITPLASHTSYRRRTWAKTLAAAGAAAAAAVVTLVFVAPTGAPVPAVNETARATDVREAPAPKSDPAAFNDLTATGTGAQDSLGVRNDDIAGGVRPTKAGGRVSSPARAGRGRILPVKYEGGGAARAARDGGADSRAGGSEEIATDFIALTHDAREVASAGGQLVRVELPRSALVRFGLPMDVERASERVKADVMLGEDGIARAIRFVR
jgi:hypothetical protein